MASITQTIPNYGGGISEQPDLAKFPGQVKDLQNGIPDITYGLYKRHGSKRIGTAALSTNKYATDTIPSNGSWFHYYRDEIEGSYIGQVDQYGKIRVWSCNDGAEKNVWYYTDNSQYDGSNANHTSISNYLTPSSATNTEDIQALTINDTTFLNNRTKTITTTGTTTARHSGEEHCAYVQIERAENGRQYGLNIYDSDAITNLSIATRIKIKSHNAYDRKRGDGHCPGIGTQVFNSRKNPKSKNLIYRIKVQGSQGTSPYAHDMDDASDYTCSYDRQITLLHGGEHWLTGNTANAKLDAGGAKGGTGRSYDHPVTYTVEVTDHETVPVKANLGLVRPSPTPFDADTAVSVDTIIGGILAEIKALDDSKSYNWYAWLNDSATDSISEDYIIIDPDTDKFESTNHGLKAGQKITYEIDGYVTIMHGETVPVKRSGGNLVYDLPDWANSTKYYQGDKVIDGNKVYICKGVTRTAVGDAGDATSTANMASSTLDYYTPEADEVFGTSPSSGNGPSSIGDGEGSEIVQNQAASSSASAIVWSYVGSSIIEEIGGITVGTSYYVGKIDNNGFKLFDTKANAEAFSANNSVTTGLINITSRGKNEENGVRNMFQATIELEGVDYKVIGNGIYFFSANPFNISIVDKDLMSVMQKTVDDVDELPSQCRHGYIVKVTNSDEAAEDDYYLRFEGENDKDGPGSWVECAAPGIVKSFNAATMPHILQRQADGDFLVKQNSWVDREVGDDTTNPLPSFNGSTINKVLFFRNRLAFLSGENVICSRPGSVVNPNFFTETALKVSNNDPVDISSSSIFPSDLYDGIEVAAGLLCFSTNQQFLLAADETVFTPDSAKLRSVFTYNYSKEIPPLSFGTSVSWVDNSGKFSRLLEAQGITREREPLIVETSKIVPSLMPNNIDLVTNSRENGLALFGKTGTDLVYGFKYVPNVSGRLQSTWFKWKLNRPLKYHFIVNDVYYYLDTDNFLQQINLIQDDSDKSITQDGVNYLAHLDNWVTIYNGIYDSTTEKTTFTHAGNCVFNWQSDIGTPNGDLVVLDVNSDTTRVGRYDKCEDINAGTSFTLTGDWSAEVRTIAVTNGGSGYTSAPTVAISGSSGSGATATATIAGGKVTAVTVTNGGSNYHAGATVAFSGGGGSSAAATATVSPLSSTPLVIGYLYEYSVSFPRIYVTQVGESSVKSDTTASLVLQRLKINFGKVGLYSTTLQRVGKDDYTEVYESSITNEYDISDAPYLERELKTIPVYDKNINVDIILKSSHPAPATLHSLTWEGDYTPKYYNRT